MDVIQFQEKLRNICELGKQNGNMLTHEQIREHFASTDLETSQMLGTAVSETAGNYDRGRHCPGGDRGSG